MYFLIVATVSDDESSSVYDEEEIPETPIQTEKRKISSLSKENQSPKGRKHKIFKSIAHETEIENIKEFRNCVRFDNIVSKINSCDQADNPDDLQLPPVEPTHSKSPKERKRRLVLTGKIVEEEKYFEDADEFLTREPKPENDNFKLNTKSRLVLNLERYKQFNQHLKLTRDWSSARKTYSRSRISESSLDGSFTSVQTVADCPKDDHQLEDLCLKSTNGENDSEVLYYAEIPKELSEYDLQDPKAIQRTRPSLISQSNSERKRVGILKEKIENTKDIESQILTKPSVFNSPSPEKPQNGFVLKEKKVPCYLRDTISNSTPKSTPEVRKPVAKVGPVITYGKNIPTPEEKKIKAEKCPVIDFDTLFKNSMKEMKLLREKTGPADESVPGVVVHSKQNGIKEPVVKRKRGRPKKIRDPPEEEQANAKKAGIKMVNGEHNIDIEPLDAKAKNLKNSQARAYIKSKRQRSIKNLNSKRVNQSQTVGKENPPSMMVDDAKTNEVTNNNVLIKTNENGIASFSSTPIAENCKMKLRINESQQSLGGIPKEMLLPCPLDIVETNNVEESVDCATRDVLSISSTINSDAIQTTEILTLANTDVITTEPSIIVANDQCSAETTLAPSAHSKEVVEKANVPTSNDSLIVNNVTEPVKRRRGRPKKIVPNVNANLHTAANSIDGANSETVQSKTVLPESIQSDAGQPQAAQTDAGKSEVTQTDAGQSQITQTDALQSQSCNSQSQVAQTDAVESQPIQMDTEQTQAMQTGAGQSPVAQTDSVQSQPIQMDSEQTQAMQTDKEKLQAAQTEVEQSQAVQTDAGQSQTVPMDAEQFQAAQTEVGKSQAAQTDAGQSQSVQMDDEQSQVAQTDAGQSQTVQVDDEQSKAAQTEVGLSKDVDFHSEQSDTKNSGIAQSVSVEPQSGTKQSNDGQSTIVESEDNQSLDATVESDAGKSKAVQSNPVLSNAVQSSTEQSVNTLLPAGHSDVVQSEAAILDTKPADVPLRKSLRTRNKNSSRSSDAFVFPKNKKEPSLLPSSEEQKTPPVPTGRRRGRPRKHPLKIDLNSSANEALLKDILDSSMGTPKTDMYSSVDEYSQKNNLNISGNEPVHEPINSVEEPTDPIPNSEIQAVPQKKKQGRPRKHPLKRDLNASVSESDNCAEVQSVTPARKRGRPRKHPLKDESEVSNQLNNSGRPVDESETSQTALRKCPRKGRPVKCVHFEALNSHSSPPSSKEIIQQKKVEADLDSSRVETPTAKNQDSVNSTVTPKPEKFILPPKKRKISGEDESIALNKEKCKDPDYSESDEVSSDEESDVEESKKLKKRDKEDLPYVPERRLKVSKVNKVIFKKKNDSIYQFIN